MDNGPATGNKLTVNSLWIGGKLTELELLTLHSFQNFGAAFCLYAYDQVPNAPSFVTIFDASSIIPREKVFRYPEKGFINWGKGSFAGFSDIFRYKLLYEKGGWWIDMDVTCLKQFDFADDYFFRNHWKFPVVGNIMKVPPRSELMRVCYERAEREVTAENTDWHKPIEILNEEITRLDLLQFRHTGLFNLDQHFVIEHYLQEDLPIPNDWYGIHWINSMGKRGYKRNSTFDKLLKSYSIK